MGKNFVKGNPTITFSEEMVSMAIEYWLNEEVFKNPCLVVKMKESKMDRTSTFEVKIAPVEEKES